LKPLKKAADFEQQLSGFRSLVLALGKYGLSEQQIGAMGRAELDGYTDALARLHGRKTGQTATRDAKAIKSLRRKRAVKEINPGAGFATTKRSTLLKVLKQAMRWILPVCPLRGFLPDPVG
jgi:hypothetical protein